MSGSAPTSPSVTSVRNSELDGTVDQDSPVLPAFDQALLRRGNERWKTNEEFSRRTTLKTTLSGSALPTLATGPSAETGTGNGTETGRGGQLRIAIPSAQFGHTFATLYRRSSTEGAGGSHDNGNHDDDDDDTNDGADNNYNYNNNPAHGLFLLTADTTPSVPANSPQDEYFASPEARDEFFRAPLGSPPPSTSPVDGIFPTSPIAPLKVRTWPGEGGKPGGPARPPMRRTHSDSASGSEGGSTMKRNSSCPHLAANSGSFVPALLPVREEGGPMMMGARPGREPPKGLYMRSNRPIQMPIQDGPRQRQESRPAQNESDGMSDCSTESNESAISDRYMPPTNVLPVSPTGGPTGGAGGKARYSMLPSPLQPHGAGGFGTAAGPINPAVALARELQAMDPTSGATIVPMVQQRYAPSTDTSRLKRLGAMLTGRRNSESGPAGGPDDGPISPTGTDRRGHHWWNAMTSPRSGTFAGARGSLSAGNTAATTPSGATGDLTEFPFPSRRGSHGASAGPGQSHGHGHGLTPAWPIRLSSRSDGGSAGNSTSNSRAPSRKSSLVSLAALLPKGE